MDKLKPLKVKVSVTLDEDIVVKVRDLAERDDRNFSQYINKVLRDHIKEHKFLLQHEEV